MLKVNFAQFNSAESVSAPLETYESLFATQEPPRKHRFARFPGPVLLTLDAAFDSGLADSEMHGVGPLGTHDLFILTDFTYMLPLVSIASYVFEAETLQFGFQPPDKIELESIEDQLDTAQVNPDEAYVRIITPQQQALIFAFIVLFGVCYSLQPTATSKYLFSRGSSIHTWKWRPVALSMLPFFVDVFFLNIGISSPDDDGGYGFVDCIGATKRFMDALQTKVPCHLNKGAPLPHAFDFARFAEEDVARVLEHDEHRRF